MKIAVVTSGGDAPGLNAVIRGVASTALRHGHEIVGIQNGFSGLLDHGELVPLSQSRVEGIERQGGTILGAASGGSPFDPHKGKDVHAFKSALAKHNIDGLVMAGGDGTMGIAKVLHDAGVKVVGVPKTIDRDVLETWITFGFDSAVQTAMDAVDKLHTTTASHDRLMVVEVMGRDAGWIALYTAMSTAAAMVAIPEVPFDMNLYAEHIRRREARGEKYHIMIASEGAHAIGGAPYKSRAGRYGGIGEALAMGLGDLTGKDARAISLGHLLRGGPPSTFDRVLGLRFGSAAVQALLQGETGVMVAFLPPGFKTVPLETVSGKINRVLLDAPEIETALNLGICFGVKDLQV